MKLSVLDCKNDVDKTLNILKSGTPLVVFDLETTGLSAVTDRILSCSAIKLEYKNDTLEEVDRLDLFINPGFKIPEEASKINGITDEMVKNAPRENQAIKEIMKFFGESPLVAGYNSRNFDEKFMNAMYLRAWGDEFRPLFHLDVFQMAKEKLSLNKHTLESVAKELGADIGLEFHTSIDDVIATVRVLKTLYPYYLGNAEESSNNLIKLEVLGARKWTKGHRLNRLYIKTEPYENVYYDIYKKEWVCENEYVDLKHIRQSVLKGYGVNNEADLVKKFS